MAKINARIKNGTVLQIGPVESDFVWLEKPFVGDGMTEKDGKYHCTILWPKSETAVTATVQQAIEAAMAVGDKSKWPQGRPRRLESPLKDGDDREKDPQGVYKGKWYISAKASRPVPVVDRQKLPILDLYNETYSGMEVLVEVGFFPYSVTGHNGVGAGLNIVMKTGAGVRRSGSTTDASTFDGFELDEADDDDL